MGGGRKKDLVVSGNNERRNCFAGCIGNAEWESKKSKERYGRARKANLALHHVKDRNIRRRCEITW